MSRSIHKYVYTSYIVQAINVVVSFVYSLVIIRLLGAAGFGDYSIFYNSLAFFLLLFGFNLPSVLVFFITNRKIEPGRLLVSSLLFTFITAIVLGLLLLNSDRLGFAIHIFPLGHNKSAWILLLVLQFILLQSNQLFTAFLNAHKIFIPVAVSSLVCNLLLLLFWIAFLLGLFHVQSPLFDLLWWVSIVFNALITVYYLWLVLKRTGVKFSLALLRLSDLRLLAGFTVIVYLCNTLQFLNYKMDVWFIHFYTGNADAGIYALALSLSQLIWILPNAISGVLLNYYQVGNREESMRLAADYGSLSFYLSLLSAIVLMCIFYFAIPIIYGSRFTEVTTLCGILFLGAIPFSMAIIIANLNSGIGFVRINLYATLFTFVLGFGLDFLLIPSYGVRGAAWTKVFIYIAGLVFQVVVARFLYKLPWREQFKIRRPRDLFRKDIISH